MNGEHDDDTKAFREAMRDVRRMESTDRAVTARRPAPRAKFTRADRAAVLAESLAPPPPDLDIESGEELVFRREGVPDTVLRKLRRGQYRVEDEIDLHGCNADEAKVELRAFLADALGRNLHCVRVIHGKGLRSGHRGPVLKGVVNSILRRVGPVVAFVSARRIDGGTGAVYVLLSDPRGPR